MCTCEKFGGCKKSFSWLGQKVNKQIDAYKHWPMPMNILIQFDIRFILEMLRIFNSLFDSSEIPDSSHPYWETEF